jgi:hypothetical protein
MDPVVAGHLERVLHVRVAVDVEDAPHLIVPEVLVAAAASSRVCLEFSPLRYFDEGPRAP